MTNKRALQTIVFFLGILTMSHLATCAQSTGTGVVSCSVADTLSNIWFRHTYINRHRPLSGKLTVTATGKYKIYVNESNVISMLTEAKTAGSETTATIDISRYLRNDSNTIAILYHPLSMSTSDQKIAISYYGIQRNGKPFAHIADNGWLCRPTPCSGNDCNDRGYAQTIAMAYWTPATPQPQLPLALWTETEHPSAVSMQPRRIITPRYSEHISGGTEYEFVTGFYGYIRLTLRGAHRGDTININGCSRICRGETDEQVTTWPEPAYYRRIRITGSSSFKASNIHVEGISIGPSRKYRLPN